MFAREVMSFPVVTVGTSTPIPEAARLLTDRGFTALPVLDDDGLLVGILSEADLLRFPLPPDPRRHPLWRPDPRNAGPRTVADVMSTNVESLTPGADVADAARMMVDEHLRCLPIVDGTGLVGVITRRDLLRCSLVHEDAADADVNDFRAHPANRNAAWRLAAAGVADREESS